MKRRYICFALVIVVSGVALGALLVVAPSTSSTPVLLEGGTYSSGQVASIPVALEFPGSEVVSFEGSCGCMALESSSGPVTFPTSVARGQRYFVKINTTGRIGRNVFTLAFGLRTKGKVRLRHFKCGVDVVPAWQVTPESLACRGDADPRVHEFRVAVFQREAEHAIEVDHIAVSDFERIESVLIPVAKRSRRGFSYLGNFYRHAYDVVLKCRQPEVNAIDRVSIVGTDPNVRLGIPITWEVAPPITYKPKTIVVASGESRPIRSIWVEHATHEAITLSNESRSFVVNRVVSDVGAGRRRTELRVTIPPQRPDHSHKVAFFCGTREYSVPIRHIP